MKLNSLRDVLAECVRDLYSAESQLTKALPRMAKATKSPELKAAFTEHLEVTRAQAGRLEQICEQMGIKAKGKTCAAMKGLIDEGAEVIAEDGTPAAKDAAMIVAAQKIEHYEIAGYGSCHTFAMVLGETEIAELLKLTLAEEVEADKKLTMIAEATVNDEASQEEDSDEGHDDDDGEDEGGEEDEADEEEVPAVVAKKPAAKPAAKSGKR